MSPERAEHARKLRQNVIESMKQAVAEKPDEFDSDRLEQAIEAVNKVPDENLDSYLIIDNPKKILLRQIRFEDAELQQIRDVFAKLHCEVLAEQQSEVEDRSSDDWYWVLKTPTVSSYTVHVAKEHSSKPYVLRGCGQGLGAIRLDEHETIEDLAKRVKCILNEDIKYGECK